MTNEQAIAALQQVLDAGVQRGIFQNAQGVTIAAQALQYITAELAAFEDMKKKSS